MRSGKQGIWGGRKVRTGDVRGTGIFRVNLGEVLYVCRGIQGKGPDVRTVKRKILDARGKSDGSGGTPSNMIYADLKGDMDAIGVGIIISRQVSRDAGHLLVSQS
jgi:hypothetical protein